VVAVVAALVLALAVAILAIPLFSWTSQRLNHAITRLALVTFGRHVRSRQRRQRERTGVESTRLAALHGAHVPTTYRVYAATTLFYATTVAIGGSLLGIYVLKAVFVVLNVPPSTLQTYLPAGLGFLATGLSAPTLTLPEAFALFLASSATVGVVLGLTVYQLRWWWPAYRAEERGRRIDASMERTVAFIYALSRSGMAFPEVMRILARNQSVYGEAAREVEIAVRDMDTFGADLIDALERLGRRTPSDSMSDFVENLVSVLQSGRSLSSFLDDQYQYFRDESEAQQRRYLDLLATLAEAYVTVLVAGPLFLITVLVVLGLVIGGTLPFLRVLGYLLIPLATAGFVVYLGSLTETSDLERSDSPVATPLGSFTDIRSTDAPTVAEDSPTTDGGTPALVSRAANLERLLTYERTRWLRDRLRDPVGYIRDHPTSILWITVPLATLYAGVRLWGPMAAWLETLHLFSDARSAPVAAAFPLRLLDDVLVQSTLFVMGSFAVVYEYRQRYLRRIEAVIPDFLDRLASTNEAGMPIVSSLGRVADSDLGALDTEMARTWTDVRWGANVETALNRLEARVRTPTVTRAVTLITNAMRASGEIGPILRIAADEAQATRRLQRERRQELMTYVLVIYISFFVFIAIVAALTLSFLPAVPAESAFSERVSTDFGGITQASKDAYELLFFHTTLVQAVSSGLVAGQMGQGSLKDGAKHATVMLAIAYVVFLVLA